MYPTVFQKYVQLFASRKILVQQQRGNSIGKMLLHWQESLSLVPMEKAELRGVLSLRLRA